jgi:hypothetical protein
MQEVKVLNLVNHSDVPGEPNPTDAIINEWLIDGWQLHSVLIAPFKIGTLELPALIVVLVRDKKVSQDTTGWNSNPKITGGLR